MEIQRPVPAMCRSDLIRARVAQCLATRLVQLDQDPANRRDLGGVVVEQLELLDSDAPQSDNLPQAR